MSSVKPVKSPLLDTVQSLPLHCGVYLMKDIRDRIIYIGKSKNIRSRVQSYFSSEKSLKNMFLIPRVHHIDYILTDTEAEAFLLEANLVKKHKPKYNVRLKDDKSYPYIRCSMEDDFPRFYMERKVKRKGSLYFGPYTEAYFVRWMIQFLNEQFQIRDCSNHFMKNRERPCLSYEIGNCPAPCVQKVDPQKYRNQVKKALSFLKGGGKSVLRNMEIQMQTLSKQERFEEAARLRNRMRAISFTRKKQSVIMGKDQNLDVFAFYGNSKGLLIQVLCVRAGSVIGHRFHFEYYRDNKFFEEQFFSFITQYYMENFLPAMILVSIKDISSFSVEVLEEALFKIHNTKTDIRAPSSSGEKQLMEMALNNAETRLNEQLAKKHSLLKGLEEIRSRFRLKFLPERMECFDISHFQGKELVASQVVFEDGQPKKEDYRKYKLRTVKGVDDFASMKEVLDRRLLHTEYEDPHLMVVDGGKGQLKKALAALKEADREDIFLVAMAKAKVSPDFSAKEVNSSQERFFIPGRRDPLVFPDHSPGLRILMHLRDEAHRFAISYHRHLFRRSFIE